MQLLTHKHFEIGMRRKVWSNGKARLGMARNGRWKTRIGKGSVSWLKRCEAAVGAGTAHKALPWRGEDDVEVMFGRGRLPCFSFTSTGDRGVLQRPLKITKLPGVGSKRTFMETRMGDWNLVPRPAYEREVKMQMQEGYTTKSIGGIMTRFPPELASYFNGVAISQRVKGIRIVGVEMME